MGWGVKGVSANQLTALSWPDSAFNCFCAGLVHPKPQNACRGICRTDIRVSINDYKKPPQGDGFYCMAIELQIYQQGINQFFANFFGQMRKCTIT